MSSSTSRPAAPAESNSVPFPVRQFLAVHPGRWSSPLQSSPSRPRRPARRLGDDLERLDAHHLTTGLARKADRALPALRSAASSSHTRNRSTREAEIRRRHAHADFGDVAQEALDPSGYGECQRRQPSRAPSLTIPSGGGGGFSVRRTMSSDFDAGVDTPDRRKKTRQNKRVKTKVYGDNSAGDPLPGESRPPSCPGPGPEPAPARTARAQFGHAETAQRSLCARYRASPPRRSGSRSRAAG